MYVCSVCLSVFLCICFCCAARKLKCNFSGRRYVNQPQHTDIHTEHTHTYSTHTHIQHTHLHTISPSCIIISIICVCCLLCNAKCSASAIDAFCMPCISCRYRCRCTYIHIHIQIHTDIHTVSATAEQYVYLLLMDSFPLHTSARINPRRTLRRLTHCCSANVPKKMNHFKSCLR